MCSDESFDQQRQPPTTTSNNDNNKLHGPPIRLTDQEFRTKSHPSHSNHFESQISKSSENKTVQTEQSQVRQKHSCDGVDDRDTEMVNVETEKPLAKPKIYCGLLFIEGLRNVKEQTSAEYFITYEGFWNQCQETTEASVEFGLNYLKVKISYFFPR